MSRTISAIMAMALLFLSAAPARAAEDGSSLSVTGKRVRIVARSAIYGFGGGLVVGLASQVFQKKPKNIFLFGSLGLYAGIFLGIYVLTTSSGPAPYEGPDTYDDFSWNHSTMPRELARRDIRAERGDTRVNFLDVKF